MSFIERRLFRFMQHSPLTSDTSGDTPAAVCLPAHDGVGQGLASPIAAPPTSHEQYRNWNDAMPSVFRVENGW